MDNDSSDSLETLDAKPPEEPAARVKTDSDSAPPETAATSEPGPAGNSAPSGPRISWWRRLLSHVNIYFLLFVLVIIVGILILLIAYSDSKHNSVKANLDSKSLSATTLAQLADSNATVGGSGQTLNVESSAVFAGEVLARQDLDVAGNLNVGGSLSLNDLVVSGTTQLGQAQINKDLAVAGDTSLQGSLNVAKSLQVNGGGTFSGPLSAPQLTTSTLQLNGDLTLNHHIVAGGATPGRVNGSALGSGGTSSVSGSDTSGSITINTGGNPAVGCFITINFTAKYDATPHVLVTPIGSAAAGLSYYVNRSASGFSVCDGTAAPAGSSFGFDYFVVG